jgi:hypothetical protein
MPRIITRCSSPTLAKFEYLINCSEVWKKAKLEVLLTLSKCLFQANFVTKTSKYLTIFEVFKSRRSDFWTSHHVQMSNVSFLKNGEEVLY